MAEENVMFYLKVTWLVGITISCLCLLAQIALLIIIPRCRKFDEKVLIHLTTTRIVNTLCEYYFLNDPPNVTNTDKVLLEACITIIFCSDFIIVSWMFMFTKNLYDKVVAVFVLDKWNLILVTAVIWTVSLAPGIIIVIVIELYMKYLKLYHRTYYCIKFLILVINTLFFIRIFCVAKLKGKSSPTRNLKDIIRTTVVAFILVLANVLQVLSTDLCVVFFGGNKMLTTSSSVLNSFHVIPITIIFTTVVRAKLRGSILRHVSVKLTRL